MHVAILALILSCTAFSYETEINYTYRLCVERHEGDDTVKGWGSAVSVNLPDREGNYLLTAAHCVLALKATPHKFEIETKKGWIPVKVVKIDKEFDICLLQVQETFEKLELNAKDDFAIGDSLTFTGCPLGEPPVAMEGKYSMDHGLNRVGRVSDFKSGFSGGSVIYDGKLVGIITNGFAVSESKPLDKRFASYLPVRRILQFLKE
jgi:S1-C subfamily serine protease